MLLSNNNEIISDESSIAEIMNNYFINVTKTLNLKHDPSGGGTLLEVINTYKDHKSITNIKTSTEK